MKKEDVIRALDEYLGRLDGIEERRFGELDLMQWRHEVKAALPKLFPETDIGPRFEAIKRSQDPSGFAPERAYLIQKLWVTQMRAYLRAQRETVSTFGMPGTGTSVHKRDWWRLTHPAYWLYKGIGIPFSLAWRDPKRWLFKVAVSLIAGSVAGWFVFQKGPGWLSLELPLSDQLLTTFLFGSISIATGVFFGLFSVIKDLGPATSKS